MKIIITIALTLVSIFLPILIIAFIKWNIDIKTWNYLERFTDVCMTVILLWVTVGYYWTVYLPNKDE